MESNLIHIGEITYNSDEVDPYEQNDYFHQILHSDGYRFFYDMETGTYNVYQVVDE